MHEDNAYSAKIDKISGFQREQDHVSTSVALMFQKKSVFRKLSLVWYVDELLHNEVK
jgi:hypothetical protein